MATPSVDREIAAAKAAWPLIANGLPAGGGAALQRKVAAASSAASALAAPAPFAEANAPSLTGPASAIAGAFTSFRGLSTRGWALTGSAIGEIATAPSVAATFARANVALYIESIYDAHFVLSQIGEQLQHGYTKLGGPSAFGAALGEREVSALAATYSEANARLHPHVGVKLGS